MKKGLSILLIVAALFGFYGSAVNLNDILACKDYWEEEGEKSTANLNKLEDGLNQLKENEQAYLDGKEQVADGEKALADAEQQLADGEAKLADGEAQYEQGLADYEAAPAKLADGKRQLDANKDAYEAGKGFKKVVDKASNGLSNNGAFNIIKSLLASAGVDGVPASYKEMADTRSSLNKLKDGTDNITGMGSEKAFKVAVGSQDSATQKKLKNAGVTSYDNLKSTIKTADGGLDSLNELKKNVDKFTGKTEKELRETFVDSSSDLRKAGIRSYKKLKKNEAALSIGKRKIDKLAAMDEDTLKNALIAQNGDLANAGINNYEALAASSESLTEGKEFIDSLVADRDKLKNYIVSNNAELNNANIKTYDALAASVEALSNGKELIDGIAAMSEDDRKDALVKQSAESDPDMQNAGITNYAALAGTLKALKDGKNDIDGIAAMGEDDRRDALVAKTAESDTEMQAANITTYAALAGMLQKLTEGKETIDSIADAEDSTVQNFLFGQVAGQYPDLAKVGITTYASLAAMAEKLTNAKTQISAAPEEQRDAYVQSDADLANAGITTYSALVQREAMLSGAKNNIDVLVDDRDALRNTLVSGSEELAEAGITTYSALEEKISKLETGKATVEQLASLDADTLRNTLVKQSGDLAAAGITTYSALEEKISDLETGKKTVDTLAAMDDDTLRNTLVKQSDELTAAGITTYTGDDGLAAKYTALATGKKQIDGIAAMSKSDLQDFLVSQSEDLAKAGITTYAELKEKEAALKEGKATIDTIAAMDEDSRKDAFVKQSDELQEAGIKNYKSLAESSSALTAGKKTIDDMAASLKGASSNTAMAFVWSQLSDKQKKAAKSQGVDGKKYKTLTAAIEGLKGTIKDLKKLKAGTDDITDMSSNEALKTAIGTQDQATQKKLKNSGITSYKALKSAISSLDKLAGFTNVLTSQKGKSKETAYKNIVNTLKGAGYGDMVSALPASYSKLAGSLGTYEDGVRQYLKGLEDYKAAPAKLADAERQLAEGKAALEDGYKQYNEGKQALADGKSQLAQYEDGEQQVRDGLATLVGTKPDLDLVGILDRLNGDGDFDNGDKHLELDEGLNAVEVGRAYQADDGDLITKEITARAVGTAGLLGAGVLAVLAAILSFLKKNKGAGVLAILAAAAGAFGAFYGTNAGTYFSEIAGSTAGSAGWIAAGILGVVALVHAVVHFTAGKAA